MTIMNFKRRNVIGAYSSIPLVAILLIFLSLISIVSYASNECSIISTWLNIKNEDLIRYSRADRFRLLDIEFNERQNASEIIFNEYIKGTLTKDFFDSCIPQKNNDLLYYSLSQTFLEKSLEFFRNSKVKNLRKIAKALQDEFDRTGFASFRAIGSFNSPNEKKGGFHRVTRSIFMNFALIAPNDWYIILIHEMLHKLDPILNISAVEYGNPDSVKYIFDLANKAENPEYLSVQDRTILQKQIIAGLNRGLLAEYRAWAVTFSLYREGLKANLWAPIAWIEDILAEKKETESFNHFVIRYLSPNFSDPEVKGLYSKTLVRNELKNIREELLNPNNPPPIGPIESYLTQYFIH